MLTAAATTKPLDTDLKLVPVLEPSPETMIKVCLVEDDAKLRATLKRYLAGQPGLHCLGDYANAESAVVGIPQERPDVVLMDINLPGMDGIECAK